MATCVFSNLLKLKDLVPVVFFVYVHFIWIFAITGYDQTLWGCYWGLLSQIFWSSYFFSTKYSLFDFDMETSEDVAKTASLQCLIMTSLIRRCNDVVFAMLPDVSTATIRRCQSIVRLQHRNSVDDVIVYTGLIWKTSLWPS